MMVVAFAEVASWLLMGIAAWRLLSEMIVFSGALPALLSLQDFAALALPG